MIARLLRDRVGLISLTITDHTGAEVDKEGATPVKAVVTDPSGTALPGSPFTASKRTGSTGIYDVQIPAAELDMLGVHDVTWTFRPAGATADETETDQVRVVGAFLFTTPQVRAADPKFTNTDDYPDADIRELRVAVEERFEKICGRAFTPQGAKYTTNGSGWRVIDLPDRDVITVVSASIDGVALTSGELDDLIVYPSGEVWRPSGSSWAAGRRNAEIVYEHGLVQPPRAVVGAGLDFMRHLLLESPLEDERATAVFTDLGGFRMSIAGRDGPTGLPEVDAVLDEYSQRIPGFA